MGEHKQLLTLKPNPDPKEKIPKLTLHLPDEEVQAEWDKMWGRMYYLFVQLYYINAHKTFFGDDHGMISSFFFIQKNFLQNCCEHNFIAFKEFFCEYVPKEKDDPDWNKKKQTLVFNYYVH